MPSWFMAAVALLVVFDFALLSLDKIYFLHQDQDDIFLENQRAYDQRISQQLSLYQQLTAIQLDITLQLLSQNSKSETEQGIVKKLIWRDQLVGQMKVLEFDEEKILKVNTDINKGVQAFLMEKLNQEVRQTLGHRIYSEFVRSKPRHEWTDDIFVEELTGYLTKQKLMKDNLKFALARIKEFKNTGVLIEHPSKSIPVKQITESKINPEV